MKKLFIILFIMIFAVSAEACWNRTDNSTEEKVEKYSRNNANDEIGVEHYKKDGIVGDYPILTSGGSKEELKSWNQILERDFNRILSIYAFNPYPKPTPPAATAVPTILTIRFDPKLNSNRRMSILYTASYHSPFSAHPTELVYTTNIDKVKNERMRLSDIVTIDKNFVADFRTWDFVSAEPDNAELNQAVKDYLATLTDEDLVRGFQAADTIGSGNLLDTYSYLTPDQLGISLGVPNYIGDHVEFVREYSKINDFLKPE